MRHILLAKCFLIILNLSLNDSVPQASFHCKLDSEAALHEAELLTDLHTALGRQLWRATGLIRWHTQCYFT